MINTTLCYIRQGGQCLMLHRVKKENDLNQGKWIGIGGKFEDGESPEPLRADGPGGVLEACPWTQLCTIPHWEGDEIFLRLIEEDVPFFSLKLRYRGDILEEAVLNGRHVKGGPQL